LSELGFTWHVHWQMSLAEGGERPWSVVTLGGSEGGVSKEGEGACVVCASGFTQGSRVVVLGCCHRAHEGCMDAAEAPSGDTCVVCREEGGCGVPPVSSESGGSATSYVQSLLGARFGRGAGRRKASEEEKEAKRAEREAIQRDILARREREARIRKELGLEDAEGAPGEADEFGLVRVPGRVVGTLGHVEAGDGSDTKVAIQGYMSHEKLKPPEDEGRESLLEMVRQRMAAEEEAEKARAERAAAEELAYQRELAEERERAKAAAEQAALDKAKAERAKEVAERRKALGMDEEAAEEEAGDPLEQLAMGRLYLKQRRAAEEAAIDSHKDLHKSGPFALIPRPDVLRPSSATGTDEPGEPDEPAVVDDRLPTVEADPEPEPEDLYDAWQRGELDEDDPWEAMGMEQEDIPYL